MTLIHRRQTFDSSDGASSGNGLVPTKDAVASEVLDWLAVLAAVIAVWAAFGQFRLWWRLGFRSPRYLKVVGGLSFALGLGLATLESQDEARPIAFVVYLLGLPGLVVFGFLFYGGPSEYLRKHPLTIYPNGVRSGSTLRLKSNLPMHDHEGRPTGAAIAAGSRWLILPGSILEPEVVWLQQPDGESHTWDSRSLLDYFEVVEISAA